MTFVESEIASQPQTWRNAIKRAATPAIKNALPHPGERVAVVGCGTSLYMAQCFATLRESAGLGETDAFPASEFPLGRSYDRVVALSRSGTTTEVLRLLETLPAGPRTVAITTDSGLPLARLADAVVLLDFADERSIVQTRFATAALAMWRAHLGEDLSSAISDAQRVLAGTLPAEVASRQQFTFLGTGWTVGLANEAALKVREASQSWAEAYPAMEFRHGPISVVDTRSVVWLFGAAPEGLVEDLAVTGALVVQSSLDPMAHLIDAQRLAVALAQGKGLNPDEPRNLTRSIILPAV